MAKRTGKLRRGSPAKQPWAWDMCAGNSDLPAQTILASHTCVFLSPPTLKSDLQDLLHLSMPATQCTHSGSNPHISKPAVHWQLLFGLPFQLGDRCFCLCTCALTWHWSQCAEGCFYSMKKFVVEPLFPGVGYKTVSSDGAEPTIRRQSLCLSLPAPATQSSAKEALNFNFPQRHILWFLPRPQDQIIFCSFVS